MSKSTLPDDYVPDLRLSQVYSEANDLETHGLEELCPAYSELVGTHERYRDGELLGLGALKRVCRTYDQRIRRWVAMAHLRAERGPDFYDLFIREAWLISSLSHPNIIKIYDMGTDDEGRPYFTMDLKSNTTLADLAGGETPSDLHHLLQIFCKVCDAMAYAHSCGIVHLDLKPENIQVDAYGEVLVCDWGLGKIVEDAAFEEEEVASPDHIWGNMTLMGQIKGSLGYMAPEQVMVGSAKEYRTDIYALGCILHFILTGQPPFTGTPEEVLLDTEASNVISPRLNYPDEAVPESLDAVVMKATALKLSDRYQSVPRLQQEIENFLTGFSTRAEMPSFYRKMRLFIRRNRTPVLIATIAFGVVAVLSALYTQHLERQKLETDAARGRADLLIEEVEIIDHKYSSYKEQMLAEKKALAQDLTLSAVRMKNLAIFERPVAMVRQCRMVVNSALQQDPDCISALSQHLALDSVELNFQAALGRFRNVDYTAPQKPYMQFIDAFPEFSYDRKKRPNLKQLARFFRGARLIDDKQVAHMERVLAYDYDGRSSFVDYAPVVEAFLQYKCGGEEHLKLSFDPYSSTLSLWSDLGISLAGQRHFGKSLLRFLPFRILKLEIAGEFELSGLNGLQIDSLDVSRCPNTRVKEPVSLPQLRTLIMRPGQFSDKALQKKFRTHEPFEIIE